jgi:phosphatidylglycerol:prolipoprotein diacylglycerol transferase
MIPYFDQPHLDLGPLTVHAFGLLVAAGIWLAARVLARRARQERLDRTIAEQLVTWVLVGGFLGAHLVDRFVYFPAETLADPLSILRLWSGLSSFGGFVGAITAIFWFVRRHDLQGRTWRYLDAIAYSFPFGWFFGRLGCFVAFDHPGSATSFPLGQRYTDGLVRHNLGLEEALYTLVLSAVIAHLGRKRRPSGFFVGVLALLYAPFRFSLDFMRQIDVRYLGLTPGQYGSLAVVVAGLLILLRARAGRLGIQALLTPRPAATGSGRTDIWT